MLIDIKELETKKIDLEKNINDYEDIFLNYYNELSIIQSNWQDNNSLSFFEGIEETKKAVKDNNHKTKKIIKIYNEIINDYQKIGDKIECNLDTSENVIDKINIVENDIDTILKKYYILDTNNLNTEIKDILYQQNERIRNIKDKLDTIKEKNKEISNSIEETESKIKNKLSKINIIQVKDEEYGKIIHNQNKIMMNTDDVEISLKKLEMYKKEEDLIIEELNDNFKEINYHYHSDNEDLIKEIQELLLNNFKKINTIHENNINKIEKHKESYIETVGKIRNTLES